VSCVQLRRERIGTPSRTVDVIYCEGCWVWCPGKARQGTRGNKLDHWPEERMFRVHRKTRTANCSICHSWNCSASNQCPADPGLLGCCAVSIATYFTDIWSPRRVFSYLVWQGRQGHLPYPLPLDTAYMREDMRIYQYRCENPKSLKPVPSLFLNIKIGHVNIEMLPHLF